jgi:hypothetical protein
VYFKMEDSENEGSSSQLHERKLYVSCSDEETSDTACSSKNSEYYVPNVLQNSDS